MPVPLTSRVAWLIPALLIVEACASGDRPTAPRFGPEFAISDAVHEGGTPGFYFLPPLVARPTFSGTFDADITTLNPQIAICDITDGPDDNCGAAEFCQAPAFAGAFGFATAKGLRVRKKKQVLRAFGPQDDMLAFA